MTCHKRRRTALRILAHVDKATGVEVELDVADEVNWYPSFPLEKPDHINAVLSMMKTEALATLSECDAWLGAHGLEADLTAQTDKDP